MQMEKSAGGGKTVTRSFRISEQAFKAIQSEADRQNISVNTLVNQLLLAFANYDRFMNKLQMTKISRATFRRILDATNDDAIIETAKLAGSDIPAVFILEKYGTVSLRTVLDYLRDLADYGNAFEYSEVPQDRKKTITLAHELGPKGTLFFGHYVQALFEGIDVDASFSLSDNAIIIQV